MRLQPYLRRLYVATFVLFVANKFVLRPFVLESDFGSLWVILVGSLPNACEAVFGVGNAAVLLMLLKQRTSPRWDRVPDLAVYALATLGAGIYVLTQEFKLHNLGGNNVYDPYDVVASIVGLVGMFWLVTRFGLLDGGDGAGQG